MTHGEDHEAADQRGGEYTGETAESGEARPVNGPPTPTLWAVPDGGAEPWPGGPDELPDQEFFIPVHGFVRLTPPEVKIVDHPAFQRLGEIFQLGQTHLVYRGATHQRFEHSLGAVHVAETMISSLARNASGTHDPLGGDWQRDRALSREEETFVRLGALLHDIGHLPAGHTLEDELGLFDKHDGEVRLNLILDRPRWHGVDTETLRKVIDREYGGPASATGLELTASEILLKLVTKQGVDGEDGDDNPSGFRIGVCRDLIGNTICADLLDYLHRDWHHLGKYRHLDMRLIEYMELRRKEGPSRSELVINLRGAEKVRTDGVSAILALLESRYELGEIALYHRTKLAATAVLERVISEIAVEKTGESAAKWQRLLTDRLLDCSDAEMLSVLGDQAAEEYDRTPSARLAAARGALADLRLRRFHKPLFERFGYHLAENRGRVQALYAPSREDGGAAAKRRLHALRLLEEDFGLPPLSLAMYCPPATMNTKIAEVKILIDGEVVTLDDYETAAEGDTGLTGGHLEAQKKRFRRLWRVLFTCRADVLRELEKVGHLPLLKRAIATLVLGARDVGGQNYDEFAHSLATELKEKGGSALTEREVLAFSAARGEPGARYPTGAPTLLALTESS